MGENGGITTEAAYPYQAQDGSCKSGMTAAATLSECYDVPQGSEADLETAVATVGPISVAIDAHLLSFRLYKHGIYHDRLCSSTDLTTVSSPSVTTTTHPESTGSSRTPGTPPGVTRVTSGWRRTRRTVAVSPLLLLTQLPNLFSLFSRVKK